MSEIMGTPTAKSLILDLLSTLRGHSMPVRTLVAAARLFAIEENNLRVSLARLCAAGVIERDERGLYRLGVPATAVERQITSWRRLEERVCDWHGGWIAVHGGPPTRGAAGRRSAQALRFLGFRALEPGLMLRPDNLAGGVTGVRDELRALGLDPHAAVLGLRDLDADRERRARGLWNTGRLLAGYQKARADLTASQVRLATLTPDDAMIESFLLGGSVLRELALDPLLPESILPAETRNELVAAMREYDRIGRAAWAGLMRTRPPGRDIAHLQAPADLRVGQAESRFHNFSSPGVPA